MLTLIGLQLLTNRDFRVRELLTTGKCFHINWQRIRRFITFVCVCVCKEGLFLISLFYFAEAEENEANQSLIFIYNRQFSEIWQRSWWFLHLNCSPHLYSSTSGLVYALLELTMCSGNLENQSFCLFVFSRQKRKVILKHSKMNLKLSSQESDFILSHQIFSLWQFRIMFPILVLDL